MGYGEAVAAKEKTGKCGRKRIETIMSRRSLKKMTNRVVFSDKCNKCERQATRKGYLGQHERAKHVDIQVVHMRVSTISAAAVSVLGLYASKV